MSQTTMENVIQFILNNRCQDRLCIVSFYGGEALLALNKMKWIINTLIASLGNKVGFSISSNGYLLTKDVVDWLCTVPDCHINVTIDGFEELHDLNRKTIDGKNTYQRILTNLKYFKDVYPQEYNERISYLVTLRCWKELVAVSDFWKNDCFFSDKIPTHVSFVMPKNIEEMSNPASSIEEKKEVLKIAFERYKNGENSLLVKQFKEWTDNISRSSRSMIVNDSIVIYTCLEDMYRVFIDSYGKLFICERFTSKKSIIGDVFNGIDEQTALLLEEKFIERRNKNCQECDIYNVCSFCLNSLNHDDLEMNALCDNERKTNRLIAEYYWKRRMFDRQKQLHNKTKLLC